MKKISSFLLIFVLIGVILMPIKASAVGYEPCGGKYCSDGDLSAGTYGTFKKGEITYEYTDEANGVKEWKFYLTPSSNLTGLIGINLIPRNIQITNIKEGTGLALSTGNTDTNVLLVISSPLKSGEKVLLFTVTTKDTSKDGCVLSIEPMKLDCSTNTYQGYYFNNEGQLITQEEWNTVCSNQVNDVPNSETGSVIPYFAVAGGLLAIAGVYLYSRKSKKMYRI